jgi:hypothetical protein
LRRSEPPRLIKRFNWAEQPSKAMEFKEFLKAADLAANEFRRSNSFKAREQSGIFEILKILFQNAVFIFSADRNSALFHVDSDRRVEFAVRRISDERLRF